MTTEKDFETRVNAILSALSPELHDFVVAAGAKHGAGPETRDRIAIGIYVAAMTAAMGVELGLMAVTLGQDGPSRVAAAFRASFLQGVDYMRDEIHAARNPN